MSFLTVSEKNKILYQGELSLSLSLSHTHTHTHKLESWYPSCKLTPATVFNIHPGETFNILLVLVQHHLQILAPKYLQLYKAIPQTLLNLHH
jgi:hypothetical protein